MLKKQPFWSKLIKFDLIWNSLLKNGWTVKIKKLVWEVEISLCGLPLLYCIKDTAFNLNCESHECYNQTCP